MALHLQKLCVGAESIDSQRDWQAGPGRIYARSRGYDTPCHTTRMMPKRADELLDGGSLYWIIKGLVRLRQRIIAVNRVKGDDGISRCDLVFDPELVAVVPRAHRPFQGWRYLNAQDAPRDLDGFSEEGEGFAHFPADLQLQLSELGLL